MECLDNALGPSGCAVLLKLVGNLEEEGGFEAAVGRGAESEPATEVRVEDSAAEGLGGGGAAEDGSNVRARDDLE